MVVLADGVFQSTPVIANGRACACLIGDTQGVFQSTPVIANGRARDLDAERMQVGVSIHARHC